MRDLLRRRRSPRRSVTDAASGGRRYRTLTIVLAVVVVVAIVGSAAVRLSDVAQTLRSAAKTVEEAAAALKDGRVAEARSALEAVETDLASANEELHNSPDLAAIGLVPIVEENLASVRDSVELASVVVHGGGLILESARNLEGPDGTLDVSLENGSIRLEDLERARTDIEALLVSLTTDTLESSPRFLLPVVREARQQVRAEAAVQRQNLQRVGRGLALLDELVGSDLPRRQLIAVANTAEMRGPGGMILNYGVLEGEDGTVELSEFGRVEELEIGVPIDPDLVGLPDDYVERWDGFDVTREWRNATMSGDFTLTAPALLAMYERAAGVPADGVIQVDPHALAGLLGVVGPVQIDEVGLVDEDNVVDLVLNDAYRRFPGVEERTDVLGDVAEATFEKLVEGDYPSLVDLADAVSSAVDGRHLLAYSATADARASLEYFDASGDLPDPELLDSAYVSIQNVSGNKLDYYLETEVDISGTRPDGEVGSLSVTVSITNTAPVGAVTPRYIFGPFDETQTVGSYRGVVSVYVPAGSSLERGSGGPFRVEPTMFTEGGRPVAGAWLDVPAGERRQVTFELVLAPVDPRDEYSITLVPSPRVRPTTATVNVETSDGTVRGEVVMDRTWIVGAGGPRSTAGY